MGHARALITLDDPDQQIGVLVKILEKGLSVREVEKTIRQLQEPPKVKEEKSQEQPEEIIISQKMLNELLDAPVIIRRNNNGKGSVVINFTSDRDLQRILGLLNRS